MRDQEGRSINGHIEVPSFPAFPEPIPHEHADSSGHANAHCWIARCVRYDHRNGDSYARAQNNRDRSRVSRLFVIRLLFHIVCSFEV